MITLSPSPLSPPADAVRDAGEPGGAAERGGRLPEPGHHDGRGAPVLPVSDRPDGRAEQRVSSRPQHGEVRPLSLCSPSALSPFSPLSLSLSALSPLSLRSLSPLSLSALSLRSLSPLSLSPLSLRSLSALSLSLSLRSLGYLRSAYRPWSFSHAALSLPFAEMSY